MAKPRPKREEVKVKTDGWIATFGDLISLMLTFFVLIISMSTLDETELKEISVMFTEGALSVLESGPSGDLDSLDLQEQRSITLQELLLAMKQKANRVLKHSTWEHKVRAIVLRDRMILRLPDVVLFEPGQARLHEADIPVLRRLARMLAAAPGQVRIEGHTDNRKPPAGSPFADAWDLSLARAASVLHVLEEEGVARSRLSLAGFGPSKPVSTDVTPFGRAKNRRVDIVLYQGQHSG